MPFFMDCKMEMKKVRATETGWKHRTLYLKDDIFEVGIHENASWFEDVEEPKKTTRRKTRGEQK